MRSFRAKLRPSPALVVAVLALAVALGGVAYATIPDSYGVIHACYDTGGNLKVIDSAQTCPTKGYTPLSWNQKGQPGPAGPKGDAGATGPAGAPGISAAYSTGDSAVVQLPKGPDLTTVQTLTVPAGKYAVTSTVDVSNNWPVQTLQTCVLSDSNGSLSSTRQVGTYGDVRQDTYPVAGAVIALQGTTTASAPDTISVKCSVGEQDGNVVTSLAKADIDAIVVNTINGS